jgi:glycosyltransferase involved in cell wall biosynthesis
VETFLLNLSREAVAAGWSVAVAATQTAGGRLLAEYESDLPAVGRLDLTSFHPAYMGTQSPEAARRRIAEDLGRFLPAVIALNDCSDFGIGAASLLRLVRPHCLIIDTFHIDPPDDQYFELRRPYLDLLDGVVGTSQRAIDRFVRHFPRHRLPTTRYIRNGVAMPNLSRKPFDGVLRLLYVGRVAQKQKRVLELPRVFQSLLDAGIRFEATIAGEGEERQALEAELARFSLLDRVSFTGLLAPADVLRLYFEHDFLLNVSSYEGFSMSVIEALAAGCIPLCTDLPNLDHEVLRDGVNSILIGVDDLGAIAGRLVSLTPGEIGEMSGRASETGRELTAARTWRGYRDFIGELQSRRPLAPWPSDVGSLLNCPWNPTRFNPWLPHPHPLRILFERLVSGFR